MPDDRGGPTVSVIIPAYRSDDTIHDCLQALRGQTAGDFEVVVVNSSQEDATSRIVGELFPEVVFEQCPRRLRPHAARLRGATLARGSILAFVDPDCIPQPDWIERLLAGHAAGHPVVGGGMALAGRGYVEHAVHLCKFGLHLPGLRAGWHSVAPNANVLYTREVWERIAGRVDDVMLADVGLSWWARELGHRPWLEPSAIVAHRHLHGTGEYCREFFLRGREFGQLRLGFARWGRGRALAYLLAAPALLAAVLGRTGRAAWQAGWGARYLATLPLQAILEGAWIVGESLAYARLAIRGSR